MPAAVLTINLDEVPARHHGKVLDLIRIICQDDQVVVEPGKPPFADKHVRIDHGTILRKCFKGLWWDVTADEGELVFQDKRYEDFRSIQEEIAKQTNITYVPSAYHFWEYRDSNGKWIQIRKLYGTGTK
jgi:hypothetical protein